MEHVNLGSVTEVKIVFCLERAHNCRGCDLLLRINDDSPAPCLWKIPNSRNKQITRRANGATAEAYLAFTNKLKEALLKQLEKNFDSYRFVGALAARRRVRLLLATEQTVSGGRACRQ